MVRWWVLVHCDPNSITSISPSFLGGPSMMKTALQKEKLKIGQFLCLKELN
jgi:hypothetical protein